MLFQDRHDAGRALAHRLAHYRDRPDVMVLALPRGGVPVAYEVAKVLQAPLDVFLVRKLGLPGHEELAIGAIASGGVRVLKDDVIHALRIPDRVIDHVADEELIELQRREREYRNGRPPLDVRDKVVIVIDDGLATGSSMRAAVEALRKRRPRRIVVAVPVAAALTCADFQGLVDEIVCADTPEPLYAVGLWYGDFSQTSDLEVKSLLDAAQAWVDNHHDAEAAHSA